MTGQGRRTARIAGVCDVIVIGAGHAGLSMSWLLSREGVDHVVLERGEVANSWRHERWDSMTLLTPNHQTRLPGQAYAGDDPDGFMPVSELVEFLDEYARGLDAPVHTHTAVTCVERLGDRYRVTTDRGTWVCRALVLATGACNKASVPAVANDVPLGVRQLTTLHYRGPQQIDDGGVLVVGASASGLQIADELLRAGRDVTVAVGEHVRMPRTYRGRDIFDWLSRTGIHDERYDEVEDIGRGRRLPSPQLVGSRSRPILDLNALTDQGATLVGKLAGVRDNAAQFSGSLANVCALADLKMQRLLKRIDETADALGAPVADAFEATRVAEAPPLMLDLERQNIRTIVWATGLRPDYRWLKVPVLNRKGGLEHDGGVVASPGLYVLGLPLMRRRKSSFIFGIEDDARDIGAHLMNYLQTATKGQDDGFHRNHAGERRLRRSA